MGDEEYMRSQLKKIEVKNEVVEATFVISHNDLKTTIEQELNLKCIGGTWYAQMSMEGMPGDKTITSSAWRLATWMERVSKAILEHEFDNIQLNNFSTVD